jgi:hypothetical protein
MAEHISTRVGHALTKLLRIDLAPTPAPLVRDEMRTYGYCEHDPTVGDWFRGHMPTTPQVRRYVRNLFPFIHWIQYYNVQWLIGDLVAGEIFINVSYSCTKAYPVFPDRHHSWRRGHSTGYGLCRTSQAASGVWFILVLYGSVDLLVLCDV